MDNVILYTVFLCIALASAETLNGVFRVAILVPRVGKSLALKVGIVTGSILAFITCYYFVPNMGVKDNVYLMAIGIIISSFMAFFDIALSMIVLKRPFKKTLQDFNPSTGNYLIFGILMLTVYPVIVMRIQ